MFKNIFPYLYKITLTFGLFLSINPLSANPPNKNGKLENGIYSKKIRSVQFFREGWEFSMPIIDLGSVQRLLLKFDDLSADTKNYSYSITHCDADWFPSRLVTAEYMEGFQENPINDYVFSINTVISYINYQLVIPNQDVRFLISGNYLLTVWEDNKKEKPVLTRQFYVVEPRIGIRGDVKKATFDGYKGANQEIDFVLDHPNFSIRDPRNDIKVVLMQNSQTDNMITNLKPLFIRQGELDYNYSKENVFEGGNEFRNFDTKDLRINGKGVTDIQYIAPEYHVTLYTDRITRDQSYLLGDDLNGNYLIKKDRAADMDLESDYIFVHFSLETPGPFTGGDIYVFGGLTDGNANRKTLWFTTPPTSFTKPLL
jgi:hypothetical protein